MKNSKSTDKIDTWMTSVYSYNKVIGVFYIYDFKVYRGNFKQGLLMNTLDKYKFLER